MLEKINFNYKEAKNQVGLFTPQHTLFVCTIEYNDVAYTFTYQCNTQYTTPNKRDMMECLLFDYFVAEMSFNEFCNEFGYDTLDDESNSIYEACEETYNAFRRLFDDDELSELQDDIND